MQKIGVIGLGPVGITYAYTLIQQELVDELVLIDINKELAMAQVADLNDACALSKKQIKIIVGDYSDITDASVVCITAAAKAEEVVNRLDFAIINSKIIANISQSLVENNFNGKVIISSNPVDVMTSVCQRVTGFAPSHVIGSGTILDSARLRKELANALDVNINVVDTLVIGEHGDSSVALFSRTTINGIDLNEYLKTQRIKLDLNQVYTKMQTAGYDIFKIKGETSYGIAMYLTKITRAILEDTKEILPVTVFAKGEYVVSDVYIPLPAVIGQNGAEAIQIMELSPLEQQQLIDSAAILKQVNQDVKRVTEK